MDETRGQKRMRKQIVWIVAIAAGLVVIGLLGIDRIGQGEDDRASSAVDVPAASKAVEDLGPPPPLDPETLAPVIREVAAEASAASRVVVEFARPVIRGDRVGRAPGGGTELRISPEVAGELRMTSPTTLSFVPRHGFAPQTTYEVELVRLETGHGLLEAPAGKRWLHVFETPAFDFVRLSLNRIDYSEKVARVDLVFSSAVDPRQVAERARFSIRARNGERSRPSSRFAGGSEPQIVSAVITSPDLAPGVGIELELDDGVPSRLVPELRGAEVQASLALTSGPQIEVHDAYRAEGTNGFYVQVVCDDAAVETRRHYWDRQLRDSFHLSTRCLLDEDEARNGIRFEPAVDFTISSARGGFRIFAPFARGSYRMRIEAGLQSVDGGMVHQAFETELSIPARSPSLQFTSKGRYLPRETWASLPVRHLNLEQATLTVRHVPDENLIFWMSDERTETADERTSDLILEREIRLSGETDVETTTHFDVGRMIPDDTTGLLEVTLRSGEAVDAVRILLTDLHLIAKRSAPADESADEQEILAWTLDIAANEPASGVELELVRKSGFVLDRCRTGAAGACRLRLPAERVDPSPPFALVARRGDDLTYLKFDELKAEVREAQIAGEPYRGEKKYRAAIYGDRGVYRPGETAHLAALVRQTDHLAPPAGLPVQVQLKGPRGKVLASRTHQTNDAGYLDLDFEFPDFAATGRYQVELTVADQSAGEHLFQVEEFVPERMRVEVEAEASQLLLGEPVELDIASRYLFGGVPAGSRIELSCEIHPSSFSPPQHATYRYGVWRDDSTPERPLVLGTVNGELGADGTSTLACPGEGRGGGFRGPAKLIARAAVFEAGSGRTTLGTASLPVHPETFYIGLSSSSNQVEVGNELVIDGVVVDWQGRLIEPDGDAPAAPQQVRVEFIRMSQEYGWFYDVRLGRENYRRYLRPVVEATQQVEVRDGTFRLSWKPQQGGRAFLVRASAGRARTDLELEGGRGWYDYSPQDSEINQTPRPGRATWIALEAPEKVEVGERFPVRFTAPYRGRVLLTAETDRVLSHHWMDVEPGESVWFLDLDDFVPNVYLTAFLIKDPRLEGAFLPDRAFGVRSVRVEPAAYTRPLKLEAPSEVRSNSTLEIKLALGPTEGPTYATVAAVDEGILSLTDFASPDPLRDLFARRALGVETFETVGWTLLVPPGGSSAGRAGDAGSTLGRVQPIRPVALWSGLLEVPASGELTVSFDLPQYRGELRLMAVSADRRRIGRAEARVTVRDPLVLQATLPRFLVADDEIEIPVFVTNLSGERQRVEVGVDSEEIAGPGAAADLDSEPAVKILGAASSSLDLADGESATAVFKARVERPSGAARLRARASAGEIESVEELEVPILPVGPKSRRMQRLELAAGELDLTPYLEGWVPLSERTTFWVTSNPYADAFEHLGYLVRYPYGCLEQTTSTTRPLLYLGSLIENLDPELVEERSIDEMAQAGIERLLRMQTSAGGFAYWMGSTEPAYWASAYAIHLLLDARDLGHPVPEARLEEAFNWIERQISHHFEPGRADRYSSNAEPYLHYVLARAGRGQKGRIGKLIEDIGEPHDSERKEHLYQLKAALYLLGDRRYERDLRHPDLSDVRNRRHNGWSFYSDRRQRGLILTTYLELFGRDEQIRPLVNLVAEGLRGQASRWYTTQELVWGITGLGKFLDAPSAAFETPILRAGGRRIEPQEPHKAGADVSKDRIWTLYRASEYDRLTLEVPSKDDGKLYLILTSEGVRTEPDWRTGGEGLRLERRYLDASGREIDLDREHALGDLVYVDLRLRNTSAERISNIALVDRIPAGWEIENPRLGRAGAEAGLDWLKTADLWQADHLDLRDDRLEVFGHLGRRDSKRLVYAVRAVTAGTFTAPPAEAEAMYDPRLWAREPAQQVVVRGPWDGGDAKLAALDAEPSTTAAGSR